MTVLHGFRVLYLAKDVYSLLQAMIALWIPGAIFSGMCLLVVLLALRLPESSSHELPTTIAEFDQWDQYSVSPEVKYDAVNTKSDSTQL